MSFLLDILVLAIVFFAGYRIGGAPGTSFFQRAKNEYTTLRTVEGTSFFDKVKNYILGSRRPSVGL
jgi:hypothetical protein